MKSSDITVHAGKQVQLKGNLQIPANATSLVIFAHGSGSTRFSVRNNFVAEIFYKDKIATLLTDLLTEREDRTFENRFDIDLLAERLLMVTSQVAQMDEVQNLPIGYFGASTGTASALKVVSRLNVERQQQAEQSKSSKSKSRTNGNAIVEQIEATAAPQHPIVIKAVVSRGGRPDLAKTALPLVDVPTLLLVGSQDEYIMQLNKQAYSQMKCKKKLQNIEGASHLFEEPGKLLEVATLAKEWFKQYLV